LLDAVENRARAGTIPKCGGGRASAVNFRSPPPTSPACRDRHWRSASRLPQGLSCPPARGQPARVTLMFTDSLAVDHPTHQEKEKKRTPPLRRYPGRLRVSARPCRSSRSGPATTRRRRALPVPQLNDPPEVRGGRDHRQRRPYRLSDPALLGRIGRRIGGHRSAARLHTLDDAARARRLPRTATGRRRGIETIRRPAGVRDHPSPTVPRRGAPRSGTFRRRSGRRTLTCAGSVPRAPPAAACWQRRHRVPARQHLSRLCRRDLAALRVPLLALLVFDCVGGARSSATRACWPIGCRCAPAGAAPLAGFYSFGEIFRTRGVIASTTSRPRLG